VPRPGSAAARGAGAGPGAGSGRRRLRTDERREQLLQVGAALFAERPYEEVWVEQVAQRAGVSRGLLYHYFPTKRDFLLGIVAAEGERLQRVMEAHPDRPAAERLTVAVDAYLAYAAEHPNGFRAFQRTAEADAEVRAIKEEYLARTESVLVAGLASDAGIPPEALRIVARGWMAFVVEACLQWLDRPALSRERLRELCVRTLLGAVSAAPGADVWPATGQMPQNRGT
jgi:AcrR family transcriptional regulator